MTLGTNDLNLFTGMDRAATEMRKNLRSKALTLVLLPVVLSGQTPAAAPQFLAAGVVNAAGYQSGVVAPGEIVSIFGENLGPATLTGLTLDAKGRVSTTLGGVQVKFDGIAAPLIFVQKNQVSAVVPYEVAGHSST